MKPELNKRYNTIAAYVLVVAAILISYILLIIYWNDVKGVVGSALNTLSPFFYGFAIAYILNPVYNLMTSSYTKLFNSKKLNKKSKAKSQKNKDGAIKIASIISTYLIALAFLSLFFSIIIPQLWQSVQSLINKFPHYIDVVEDWLNHMSTDFPFLANISVSRALTNTDGGLIDWLETVYDTFKEYTPKLFSFVTGFATQVWNFLLGFIISVYMLADKKRFIIQGKRLICALFTRRHAKAVSRAFSKANHAFGGFLSGKIIDSFIIGVLCFIGMSILQIPYSPLVSVVVGVTNVIPYFGPFLGAIPSLFIILLDSPIKAVWFGIFILILQQLDGNVIGPKIIGEKIGLTSFWVIFALLIMGSVLGVLGLLLAVPIFALLYDFFEFLCKRALKKKRYEVGTDTDFDENSFIGAPVEESDDDDDE